MGRAEVAVLLWERLMVVLVPIGASNSRLAEVGYFELGCLSGGGLDFLGLGMSTMSLMFWMLLLQLALGIRILGFGW